MGTEVLRPQDCWTERIHYSPVIISHRRKNFTGNGKSVARKNQNRRRSSSLDDVRNKTPVVDTHVTILRRGQSLDQIENLKPIALSPSRVDVYAGSTVAMSPSPRALPLPSFFSKKTASRVSGDESATRDLRRLLRLE